MRAGCITTGAAAGLAALALGACGSGGSGYGCTGRTCKATFENPGSLDMTDQLGHGATIRVRGVLADRVTVSVGRMTATARRGRPVQVGRLRITPQRIEGQRVTLRVVASA